MAARGEKMLLLISGLGDENTKLEFGQIYEKNYRTMYYVALKILKNKEEAEDAVHGAFVKLAEKYDTYRHLTSQEMTSLCVIIVKNKCLDMLRVSKSGLQSDWEKVDYALHGVESRQKTSDRRTALFWLTKREKLYIIKSRRVSW